MKESSYTSYDELPLFLNAATVAKALGVSPSSGCKHSCRATVRHRSRIQLVSKAHHPHHERGRDTQL